MTARNLLAKATIGGGAESDDKDALKYNPKICLWVGMAS